MTSASKSPLPTAPAATSEVTTWPRLPGVLPRRVRRDERHDRARGLQSVQWSCELAVLEAFFDEDRDALAGDAHARIVP